MKFLVFNRFFFFLLLIFSLLACQEKNKSIDLLKQARGIAEVDPSNALILLDSISNPKSMSRDNYMQYIIVRAQAEYKTKQNIANDTLIFEAQHYFEKKQDQLNTALSYFYAGGVYYKRGMPDKALNCYLRATDYAKIANNYILAGRSLNNIGFLYFERDVMDSAITRYRQALSYYDKDKSSDSYKLQLVNLTGRAYNIIGNSDSAYFYFNKGLDLALGINDLSYQATFMHQLGIVSRQMGNYQKSLDYLYRALAQTSSQEESLRICLSLSEVYNKRNQLDSVKHYTNLIKNNLSEITDNYVLQSMYSSLYNYNKRCNNYQEALYYADLQKDVNRKIVEADNSQKLLAVEKAYQISLKEKELAAVEMRSYLYLSIGIFIVLLIWLTGYFRNKNMRNKHEQEVEKNRLLKKQYDQQVESLAFLKNIYRTITSEWTAIDREVDSLAIEYGAREKPTIYMRIKELIDNLKQDTNERLIKWTKNHLEKNPFGEKIIPQLNDNDLLLLGLSCYGYEKSEIADILGIPIQKVHTRKLALRHDFRKVGMPDSLIDELLFTNND